MAPPGQTGDPKPPGRPRTSGDLSLPDDRAELVRQYAPLVKRLLHDFYRYMVEVRGTRVDFDTLESAAFESACEAAKRWRGDRPFPSLLRVAVNRGLVSAMRTKFMRETLWPRTSFEAAPGLDPPSPPQRDDPGTIDMQFTDRERAAMLLYWRGLTTKQIATVLGVHRQTVDTLRRRLRERLTEHLRLTTMGPAA